VINLNQARNQASSIIPSDKNIVLSGFMGAGKTTVGQILASRLNRDLIDADEEIERRQGMTIAEIFKRMGEPGFRQIERAVITDLCVNNRGKVVSLGGGAFMQQEIRDICLSSAIVVFLDVSWERWKERISLIKDTRPLLQTKSMEEVRELFDTRRKVYSLSHFTIHTDQLSPEEIADQIIRDVASGLMG
jgi:shikimate kinase